MQRCLARPAISCLFRSPISSSTLSSSSFSTSSAFTSSPSSSLFFRPVIASSSRHGSATSNSLSSFPLTSSILPPISIKYFSTQPPTEAAGVYETLPPLENVIDAGKEALASLDPATVEAVLADCNPYLPVYWVTKLLSSMHDDVGLSWVLTIAATTFAFRLFLIAPTIYQRRQAARLSHVTPELEKLKATLMQQGRSAIDDPEAQAKIKDLFRKHNANPFGPFLTVLLQSPLFVSMFISLKSLAEANVLQGHGALWFQDLCELDPYYILPVVSAGAFLYAIEVGAETGTPMKPAIKIAARGMGVILLLVTSQMPSAIAFYWATNGVYSLVQNQVLKIPAVTRACGIPKVYIPPTSAAANVPVTVVKPETFISRPPGIKAKDSLK